MNDTRTTRPRRLLPPPVARPFPFKPHPLDAWGPLREEVQQADRALRRLEREVCRRHGVSTSEAAVLIWAYRHHGTTGASAARALRLSKARVSQVVSRLEHRRLVWRRARGEGGRVAGLYPTIRGQNLALAVGDDVRRLLERAGAALDAHEMDTLMELCGRLARAAELAVGRSLERRRSR